MRIVFIEQKKDILYPLIGYGECCMRTELDLYLSSPQIINESILSQIKETKGEPAEPYVSPQQQIINEWTTRHGRVTTKKIKKNVILIYYRQYHVIIPLLFWFQIWMFWKMRT
eukprot:519618_1